MNKTEKTLENILNAAQSEFLEKGFKSASLRNIVKTAGVTTGAFYGYFKSKEELFESLVEQQVETFMDKFEQSQKEFSDLPMEKQPENMGKISMVCINWMVDYMYDNKTVFKLLFCCAEGTKYENLIHHIVEIETKGTDDFVENLKQMNRKVEFIDKRLEHLLISGMFTAFFELIIHDIPRDSAKNYAKMLHDFYSAGWAKIMGL